MNRPPEGREAKGWPAAGSKPAVVVVMGVAGSGKSTIGRALAERLGWPFYEGDDYHPPANVAKMSRGVPLTDEDRAPWLAALGDLIAHTLSQGRSAVLAASSLKRSYRQQLRQGHTNVVFVYLRGSYDLISNRLEARHHHFMDPELLSSQFDILEPPRDAIVVEVDDDEATIVDEIVGKLRGWAGAG